MIGLHERQSIEQSQGDRLYAQPCSSDQKAKDERDGQDERPDDRCPPSETGRQHEAGGRVGAQLP